MVSTSVLPREIPVAAGAFGAAVAVLVLAGVLFFGEYTKHVSASGVLVPSLGTVRLQSRSTTATVVEARVRPGQTVRRGEVLFVLSEERIGEGDASPDGTRQRGRIGAGDLVANLKRREDRITASTREQAKATAQSLAQAERQVVQAQAEIDQLEVELDLQQRRVRIAKDHLERHSTLAQEGYVTDGWLTTAKSDLLEQQGRLEQLRRTKLTLVREQSRLADAKTQLRDSRERDLAQLQQTGDELQHQRMEREIEQRIVIEAPEDGTITNVLVSEGQVPAGKVLATLVPASAMLEAEVHIASKDAGQLSEGQNVRLRFMAYPYQRYGQYPGKVLQVAQSGVNASERGDDAEQTVSQTAEKFYRVRIGLRGQSVSQPGGKDKKLAPGDRFDAEIAVERRSVLDWLIQPVKAIKNRMQTVSRAGSEQLSEAQT